MKYITKSGIAKPHPTIEDRWIIPESILYPKEFWGRNIDKEEFVWYEAKDSLLNHLDLSVFY